MFRKLVVVIAEYDGLCDPADVVLDRMAVQHTYILSQIVQCGEKPYISLAVHTYYLVQCGV
jgi:hypothetical protein